MNVKGRLIAPVDNSSHPDENTTPAVRQITTDFYVQLEHAISPVLHLVTRTIQDAVSLRISG